MELPSIYSVSIYPFQRKLSAPPVDELFLFFYRKHSSGDLHSRLKTRKLLGVGETDDGDVHRSKVKCFCFLCCNLMSVDHFDRFGLLDKTINFQMITRLYQL
jgi:hypothetical protein